MGKIFFSLVLLSLLVLSTAIIYIGKLYKVLSLKVFLITNKYYYLFKNVVSQ